MDYRPDSTGISASGGFYIAAAFFTGIAAIALISLGISSLSPDSSGLSIKYILISAGVLFIVMLAITTFVFHRVVTSELLLIHIWAALELSAVIILYGTGYFGVERTVILAILTGIAYIVGMVCYVLYYNLNETASYWNGMIPLITDSIVIMIFIVLLIFNK